MIVIIVYFQIFGCSQDDMLTDLEQVRNNIKNDKINDESTTLERAMKTVIFILFNPSNDFLFM